jgi:hypothetical protein
MQPAEPTSPVASPPDPAQDHPATTAPGTNIDALLHAARTLLSYGRHLFDTLRQRAAAPNFNTIAACFGTANLATISAHLNRGILRAFALERVLLARAAKGRDIEFSKSRVFTLLPAPEGAEPGQFNTDPPLPPARSRSASIERAPRQSRPIGWDDPELFMPTLEELEREVRRDPIGRTFFKISRDLGIAPLFCHLAFWNALCDIMNWFGGGLAVGKLVQCKNDRRKAFSNELDRKPGANWDWLDMSHEAIRQVLGFVIGETPVNPLEPTPATGPP